MMTFSIIIILLMLTIPSQKYLLTQSTTDVMRLQLLRAINLAHNEAMIRNEKITLCQSADQKTCSGHWRDGYIILAKDQIIYSFVNPRKQGELYWRAFPKNQMQLDYLPSGILQAENGTFWYCLQAEKNPRWAIVLSQSGRAREILPKQPGGVIKDGEGEISCNGVSY
jgi:Tfp pilus assembly protein FimT